MDLPHPAETILAWGYAHAGRRFTRDWLLVLIGAGVGAPGEFPNRQQGCPKTEERMVPSSDFERQELAGPELAEDLERRIVQRTWGRIHRLHVERQGDQVIIHGYSPSYYVKQLALLAVQEIDEALPVQLDIQVGQGDLRPSEGRNQP